MTNLLITSKETGKQYDESQLAELLRDEGHSVERLQSALIKYGGGWWIEFSCELPRDSQPDTYPQQIYGSLEIMDLERDQFSISFTGSIPKDKVKEMVDEIKNIAMASRFDSIIDTIASRFGVE